MAPFTVYCPHCNQLLTTDSLYTGQVVACPLCRREFTVPPMPTAAPPGPQPPPQTPQPPQGPQPPPYQPPLPQFQGPQPPPYQPAPPRPTGPQPQGFPPFSPQTPPYQGLPGYQPPSGYGAWQQITYAGFWKRLAAIIIDSILLFVITCGIAVPVVMLTGDLATIEATGTIPPGTVLGIRIFSVVLQWLYFTLSECSSKQATLGKRALGIIVTDLEGNRISFGRANARYWSKLLSAFTCLIGFIMAGFTEKKQALHDLIASTLVINQR